jgi:hypothetical protein
MASDFQISSSPFLKFRVDLPKKVVYISFEGMILAQCHTVTVANELWPRVKGKLTYNIPVVAMFCATFFFAKGKPLEDFLFRKSRWSYFPVSEIRMTTVLLSLLGNSVIPTFVGTR